MLLMDVVMTHPLIPQPPSRTNVRYPSVLWRLLNMRVTTFGGLASDASKLVQNIGEEGEKVNSGSATAISNVSCGVRLLRLWQRGNGVHHAYRVYMYVQCRV